MARPLRQYQERAVRDVVEAGSRHRRICLVAPTGAGKTRLGAEFVARATRRGRSVLWVCHRAELQSQAAASVAEEIGGHLVQVLTDGHAAAPVSVATVQSSAWESLPGPGLIVLDEAHHYAAAEWGEVARHWPDVPVLGLTATPERSDGRPLGDIFSGLVVAAHYSELIAGGYIVPCRVMAPVTAQDATIALPPVAAYLEHGEGRSGFCFAPTVEAATELAQGFVAAGVMAAVVSERTPAIERRAAIRGLADGTIRILCNVYALTEGVDVPSASVCLLARGVGHVSPYLQMVGRVLRAHPGKRDALLLDLSGAALVHGSPTADREYSLGSGIVGTGAESLTQCLSCGYCWTIPPRACPRCGEVREPRDPDQAAALAISGTPLAELTSILEAESVRRAIYRRLRAEQRERGFSLWWVLRRYAVITGQETIINDATKDEKQREYSRIEAEAKTRGWKRGAASHRYRAIFGCWPRGVERDPDYEAGAEDAEQ